MGNLQDCFLWVAPLNIESSAVDFSGNYSGTFWGTDSGNWQVTINKDGSVTGSYYSFALRQRFSAVGEINSQGEWHFSSASTGITLSGLISCNGGVYEVSGTWLSHIYTSDYGSFSGQRQ